VGQGAPPVDEEARALGRLWRRWGRKVVAGILLLLFATTTGIVTMNVDWDQFNRALEAWGKVTSAGTAGG